jgi:pimeloyl-ACP methyl ester carboxylesterase
MVKADAGIKGRLIHFVAKDRSVLNGFLVGPRRSRRCMVYVHGMTGNFYGGTLQFRIAESIGRAGFSLFSINTRGHDAVSVIRKQKGRKIDRFMAGTDLERFEDSVLDIDAAVKKLWELGFRQFILAGHSTGCQKVTYYQYKKMSRKIMGILLLAPADDYAIQRKELGKRFDSAVKLCRKLIREGKGNEPSRLVPSHYSPRRFLSVADLKNVEARLFDYGGPLREFSRITAPVCAVFGRKEEYATMPVVQYLRILRKKTGAEGFVGAVVDGAGHSFRNHNEILADFVLRWVRSLDDKKKPMREIVELHPKFPLALLGYS